MKAVIIGTGLTGLMAAGYLSGLLPDGKIDSRVEVTLLGDGAGTSPYVHGINLPLDSHDSEEVFFHDTLKSGYNLSDKRLASCLCYEALSVLDDFKRLGVFLDKKDGKYVLLKSLGSSYPRVAASGNDTGAKLIAELTNRLKKASNICLRQKTRALKLIVDEGQISGVRFWNKNRKRMYDLDADLCLIACGGFCGIYPFSTNPPESGGDGIAMAYQAGAQLCDLEFIQFEPSVALSPDKIKGKSVITTMFYEGAVLRNRDMVRFLEPKDENDPGECIGKDLLSMAIYHEIQKGKGTANGGVWFDATGVGKQRLNESYQSYVERYLEVGIDISKEPFEIAPAPHTSLGGIRIDEHCRTNIRGLYAAGEVAGGLHGANRIGGNAGLETLVFGKRSGLAMREELGEYSRAHNTLHETEKKQSSKGFKDLSIIRLKELRTEVENILQKDLNLVRDKKGLMNAQLKLEEISEELGNESGFTIPYEKCRLENDVCCAMLLTEAALARTGSVGCHVREDDDGSDSSYHVVLQKDAGVRKEKIDETS